MAKLLYKLGKFIAKNKWVSILAWLIVLGVIITPLMINSPKFDDDITMNGLKSLDTNDKITKEFHQDSQKASMKIVFHSDKKNGITDKDTKKDIEKALDNIKQDDDYVQNVSNPIKLMMTKILQSQQLIMSLTKQRCKILLRKLSIEN